MTSPLDLAPVVPVVVLDDVEAAVPLARALVAGGLPAVEVTLRTEAALGAIERIAAEVEGARVGAGTVLTPEQAKAAAAAGATFLVTPGTTESLVGALQETGLDFLPGTSTVSEVLRLRELGIREMKFFPAEAAGGAPFLKSLASPVPDVRFCPTGGITPESAPSYLALPNVACVGGSWMLPGASVAARDWGQIEALARAASRLRDKTAGGTPA
ncbi:bifunctional 4-hydroxy-2-oxoglutarate aldolase/2-dehydro-3-deoxy-phosphogluconate aldolase [Yinghuangia soli]|uniref:2-dehydro-3-deoxy-phosphogluconate aldolase n=1 Tax=Yinghuangia soli TaxID=2908204 RepID=A0AA41PVM6_9ACTN|nr:bifunctional 4-hydroxy-2-oxoglutarate aldolase/2-dehydro-3-deoxy-phosphogluconate aldolase [Yinghuangia soli]MCF2526563.1 bifunctional 4-hydroxy-2-oxoglutarate aldolase/2-dehydro-3-deoxy-phosphogluconate aldolase [Yinghuangia soli]